MQLQMDKIDDVTVVVPPTDTLDAHNSPDFKEAMAEVIQGQKKVVIDLGRVQFVDSSGCGAMLTILKHLCQSGGDLKVCCLTPPVRALFDLVRMHRIIDVHKTRDDAVRAFAAKKPAS